ncbi:Ferrous iron uptake protein [Rickettsiales bacterium Ac37b]|nr:Ferrous iron uptake protein [Rickettsiales bacterium Ac37b]
MFAIALIFFRELLEVTLITGIIMAATKNVLNRNLWVIIGISLGVICSGYIAYSANSFKNLLENINEEAINVIILFTAVIMLNWTIISMKHYTSHLKNNIKKVGQNVQNGTIPLYTIATIIFVAVVREGIEIILFTYGVLKSSSELSYTHVLLGMIIGSLGGISLGIALYYGIINIKKKYMFSVTTILLILLTSSILIQIPNHLPLNEFLPSLYTAAWNTSDIIREDSLLGSLLHVTIGYIEQPSKIQLILYLLEITIISSIIFFQNSKVSH